MNNLKISTQIPLKLPLQSEEEVVQFAALDVVQSRLFLSSSANIIYTTVLPYSNSYYSGVDEAWNYKWMTPLAEPIDLDVGDSITSLEYLMEKEALIIGTSSGSLLLYSVDHRATKIVGRVEGGVSCLSPSPDGDLLCIITGFSQMLMMTHDWDLLYEMALEDLGEDVGICDPCPHSNCLFNSRASWRGDGKYFATTSKVNNSLPLHRKLKVWERDTGNLHSVSEPKAFVGEIVEWMPSGAKIAAVYDHKEEGKSPSIVFFERNGLERSSFTVNAGVDATIEVLKWNCHSDLLAAIVRSENYDSIKIWFFNNNHWYLKQEIRYLREDGVKLMWHPIQPNQLICWTLKGQITAYKFIWVTAVTENSVALVIDDSKVLVTPLFLSFIPPPMYLFELKFPCPVGEIAFWPKGSKNCLAASLSDGSLCIVEFPELDSWEDLEGKVFGVEASISEVALRSFLHLTWLDSHVLLGVSSSYERHSLESSSRKDELCRWDLQEIELFCYEDHIPGSVRCSGWHATITSKVPLEMPVIGIAPHPLKSRCGFVQLSDGLVFDYTSKLDISAEPFLQELNGLRFSSPCPWMSVVSVEGCGLLEPYLIFGLDSNNRLHVKREILCNNCISFSFYSNSADQKITHLILTTKQDLLFVVDVHDIVQGQIESRYGNFLPTITKRIGEDEKKSMHIWERGATILGVLHGDESAVILHTARGNLECIYPRKLVLASIVNALVQGRFKDALLMVRRHRIDFNVIVDHCGWKMFLQSAMVFVKQVNNLSYITEFVCSLKNENVMETLYKYYISGIVEVKHIESMSSEVLDGNNKVSSVLLAVRKALEEHVVESPARELCILTTLARSEPPALEEALERVKIIREMELLDPNDPRRASYPSAEESLKHLLWLSDTSAVYEAALGLYDLNLAAIVALNAQQDPKEFLPFLQELESLPTFLMRYKIDLKLQRFEKALQHIVSAGDAYFEDCINLLAKNPELFPLGLKLINDPSKRKLVLEAWGDHLVNIKCFEDAATTYLCCSSLEKALKAFRACNKWGGVLTVAGLMNLGKEEIMQLAHDLCEELQTLGKPAEAAKIALEYCGDVKSGISLLISAREWEEALRIAFMQRRDDLVSEVKTASVECAVMLIGEYEEALEKVGKYLARYLAVRQRRLLLAAKLQADERSIHELDDDTASEASSIFSGMSAYTTGTRKGSAASVNSSTTSKTRGKARQRNKGKIRAGSPGEEFALVEHLKGMSLSGGARHELKSLLASLVMIDKEDYARKLQRTAENFQLSQLAAVKLAEDAMSSDIVDQHVYSLDLYVHKAKNDMLQSDDFSWQYRVFLSS